MEWNSLQNTRKWVHHYKAAPQKEIVSIYRNVPRLCAINALAEMTFFFFLFLVFMYYFYLDLRLDAAEANDTVQTMTNKTVVNGCRDFMAGGLRRCSTWWQQGRQCALFLANGQVAKIRSSRRPTDSSKEHEKKFLRSWPTVKSTAVGKWTDEWCNIFRANEDKRAAVCIAWTFYACPITWPLGPLAALTLPPDAAVDAERRRSALTCLNKYRGERTREYTRI